MECKIIHNFILPGCKYREHIGEEMVNGPKLAVSSPFFRLPPPSPANIPLTLAYLFIVFLFASTYVTAINDVTKTPCCGVNRT